MLILGFSFKGGEVKITCKTESSNLGSEFCARSAFPQLVYATLLRILFIRLFRTSLWAALCCYSQGLCGYWVFICRVYPSGWCSPECQEFTGYSWAPWGRRAITWRVLSWAAGVEDGCPRPSWHLNCRKPEDWVFFHWLNKSLSSEVWGCTAAWWASRLCVVRPLKRWLFSCPLSIPCLTSACFTCAEACDWSSLGTCPRPQLWTVLIKGAGRCVLLHWFPW